MKRSHEAYERQVYQEAAVVGLTMLPMWVLVSRATDFFGIRPVWKSALDVALAGAAFHLIAEESGVNAWYVQHGAAVQQLLTHTIEREQRKDGAVLVDDIDWLCRAYNGRCG
jgi:hypothetical protein